MNSVPIKPETLYLWAKKKFGDSKCMEIKYCNNKNPEYGQYSFGDKVIRLNLRHIRNRTHIYRVVAHEWTHAQQSATWYFRYQKIYGYHFNPYEVRARERERKIWTK